MELPAFVQRFLKNNGYVPSVEVTLQIEKAVAAASTPELLSAVMTSLTTGIAPEKSYAQLVEAYKSWVYTSIDKIAKTLATRNMRLFIYRRVKDGKKILDPWAIHTKVNTIWSEGERKYALKQMGVEKEEVFEHPWLNTMRFPNGIMSRMVLWYETMMRMELGGLCVWYMAPNRLGLPAEVWPLPLTKTAEIKPVVDSTMHITEWIYKDGTVNNRFQPKDIVCFKYPNPASPFLGYSPLMAQTYPYDIDLFLMQQQRALFQNKGIPGIHLHTDQPLTKEQMKEILDQVKEQWGRATQSGQPFLTHSGLTADKSGWSNRDSMFSDVSKWSREKVITSYDLSEAKLGLEVPANRANMEVLDETFEKECIIPKSTLIEEQINAFVLPRYDNGLVCMFERAEMGDRQFEIVRREMELRNFVVTINDDRTHRGLDPVPWGDKPFIPFSLVQWGEEPEPEEPDEEEEEGDAKPPPKKGVKESRRQRRLRAFSRLVAGWEKMIFGLMKGYFSNEREAVLARLSKYGPRFEAQYAGWSRKAVQKHIAEKSRFDDINIDKGREAKRLKSMMAPPVTSLVEQRGKAFMREFDIDVAFNVNDPKVVKWLGSRLDAFSDSVAGSTFTEIDKILRVGFSEGKPLTVIADTLREKFETYESYRSSLIARTETVAASNKADLLAITQAGIEDRLVKIWLTAGDEAVRETHAQAGMDYADGIPIDEMFQVGDDEMDSPGNGSLPEENINCRCTMDYEKS